MKAFRYPEFVIAAVVVQAAMIAWAFFGLSKYIDDGGVVNKDKIEGTEDCESIGSAMGLRHPRVHQRPDPDPAAR